MVRALADAGCHKSSLEVPHQRLGAGLHESEIGAQRVEVEPLLEATNQVGCSSAYWNGKAPCCIIGAPSLVMDYCFHKSS